MSRSSKLSGMLALSLLVFAVWACSGGGSKFSFPEDKKDYIGDWRGQADGGTMKLSISSDGAVNYERQKGSNTKTITGGKITKFDGNDFEVKVLLMSATFKVSKPPYRDGNNWKMVVDDVELTRRGTGSNSNELSINIAEMHKADDNGEMSDDVTDKFSQSDKVIYRFVTLNNPKAGTAIKFVTVVVDAGDTQNEVLNETTVTTEKDAEDEIRSTLKVTKGTLSKGDYKVDIYLNNKLERTLTFKIV